MSSVKNWLDAFLQLVFPVVCLGCGKDVLPTGSVLCLGCLASLPRTGFESQPDNPVEQKFYGRLPVDRAAALYYFTAGSVVQRLMHELKYRHNRELGWQLGRLMGIALQSAGGFPVDALIPLPLFKARERRRGYNQSKLLCEGIAREYPVPLLDGVLIRPAATATQTRKSRLERWENMQGRFVLTNPSAVAGKRLLLVDDVITTGATLEAAGAVLAAAAPAGLSIMSLCYANR